MRIHFWGVRGSLPAPKSPAEIREKISAVMERLKPGDIRSAESRERFLAAAPPWLFGTVGGNTTCLSIQGEGDEFIVLDAGSGIRELGAWIAGGEKRPSRYRLFFTHYHWDHLQGFPFFGPAYDPAVTLECYSPMPGLEEALRGQMRPPYFPVGLEAMASAKNFHLMEGPIEAGGLTISFKAMNHPGGSFAYLADDGKRRFVFATDAELTADDFIEKGDNVRFFRGTDLVVIDAQYTLKEAIDKSTWGHSAFSMAVDFAANWGIKHLVLFHHDPYYDDRKLFDILGSAREYMRKMNIPDLQISLATEGMEILL